MIKVGDRLPEATFRIKDDEGNVAKVTTGEYFAGKKVIVVGVPGAFTSTCHKSHIPAVIAGSDVMKAKGIDKVAVLSVNDHHVMRAWAESLGGVGKVDFLADGAAEFVKAAGLVNDVTAGGLGIRTHRFAMRVDDGVVKSLDLEPDNSKVAVSSAETILERL
ncbi:MAG: peroxiredoxin [Bauldia sp.]